MTTLKLLGKNPVAVIMLPLTIVFFLSVFCVSADQDPPPSNISLEYQNKPIKQILADLARLSGMEIYVNEEFANTLVTGEIYDASVDDALKRIIRNLNHTIIYETDNKIMVYIYAKGSSSGPAGRAEMPMIPTHEWLGPQNELPAEQEVQPPADISSSGESSNSEGIEDENPEEENDGSPETEEPAPEDPVSSE